METRRIGALASIAIIALALGACDDNRRDDYGYSSPSAYCAQFATCGACTPVIGCGWCYNGDGTGTCASDPDYCTGKQFSWTWEPTGCHVAADAGANPRDAGASDGARDAIADAPSATDAPADAPIATDANASD